MKHFKLSIILLLLIFLNASTSFCQNDLNFINIGDLKTVEGKTAKHET
jgi:hypothetical protein